MKDLTESIQQFKDFLNSLSPIEPDVLEEYTGLCEILHLAKNEKLVAQGQSVSSVFFIVKGLVRFYYSTSSGDEVIKSFYGENGVVTSYTSLLTGEPSNLTIECLEDTTVLQAPFHTIRAMNDQNLNLQICARKIAEREFISKDIREYEFLTMNSKDRYLSFQKRYPDIARRVPLKYIASYLGIRSETLSRIKAEL